MDPSKTNFFLPEIEFTVTTGGEILSNTTEVELGKRIEVNFVSLSNTDNFYIENCTAMDSELAEVSANTLNLIDPGLDI